MHGNYNILPNETLARVVDASLRQVGGVTYTEEELSFAQDIWETFEDADLEIGSQMEIQPFRSESLRSSSDVGDVSWLVPTVGSRPPPGCRVQPPTPGRPWPPAAWASDSRV